MAQMMDAEELLSKNFHVLSREQLEAHTRELHAQLESAVDLIDRMTGSQHFYSLLKIEEKRHAQAEAEMQRAIYSKDRELDSYREASDFIIEVVDKASSEHELPSGNRADAMATLLDDIQDRLRAGLRYFKKNLPGYVPEQTQLGGQ